MTAAHELVADGTCSGGCCTVFQCTRCTYRCVQAATLLSGSVHPDAEANEEVLLVERGIMDVGEAGANHEGTIRLAIDAAQYGVPDDPLGGPVLSLSAGLWRTIGITLLGVLTVAFLIWFFVKVVLLATLAGP